MQCHTSHHTSCESNRLFQKLSKKQLLNIVEEAKEVDIGCKSRPSIPRAVKMDHHDDDDEEDGNDDDDDELYLPPSSSSASSSEDGDYEPYVRDSRILSERK